MYARTAHSPHESLAAAYDDAPCRRDATDTTTIFLSALGAFETMRATMTFVTTKGSSSSAHHKPPTAPATATHTSLTRSHGMDPAIWGPPLWDILFTCAIKIRTVDDQILFTRVIQHVRWLLPCANCRTSFNAYLDQYPLPCTPSCDLKVATRWLWCCKDSVNQKLKKPYRTYKEAMRRYRVFHCCTSASLVADTTCIFARNISDRHAKHVIAFEGDVLRLLTPTLGIATTRPMLEAAATTPDDGGECKTASLAIAQADAIKSTLLGANAVVADNCYDLARAPEG